jgi:hypothetical protein
MAVPRAWWQEERCWQRVPMTAIAVGDTYKHLLESHQRYYRRIPDAEGQRLLPNLGIRIAHIFCQRVASPFTTVRGGINYSSEGLAFYKFMGGLGPLTIVFDEEEP